MLKNRSFTFKIEKPSKEETDSEPKEQRSFEEKAEVILEIAERVAFKGFLCVLTYVVFDTYRQVSVARASHD